jgi:F-type H+-transporting ATPase subunit epsilon
MDMHLNILLPFRIFVEVQHVKHIVMETSKGAFGLLPHRQDCVAALVPGIFTYRTDRDHYVAIDEGVMVKADSEVWVSVRSASLPELQESVEKTFKQLDEKEKEMRAVMARMESGFLLSLEKFRSH